MQRLWRRVSAPIIVLVDAGSRNAMRVLYSGGGCGRTGGAALRKASRHIPQDPERILDAPDILDDYCTSLFHTGPGHDTADFRSRRWSVLSQSRRCAMRLLPVQINTAFRPPRRTCCVHVQFLCARVKFELVKPPSKAQCRRLSLGLLVDLFKDTMPHVQCPLRRWI